ncbi:hypothetical protein MRY87_08355 [bacterium]|nr:hypothetical protein [bacterium]
MKRRLLGFLVFSLLLFLPVLVMAAPCVDGEVGGTLFRDYDGDGTQDDLEPALGETDVTISAYDASGTRVGTTQVDTDGNYSLGALSVGEGLRLELTGIPGLFTAGAIGDDGDSSVRFASSLGCSYDFVLHNARQYCEEDPQVAVACFQNGTGTDSTAAGVVSYTYSNSGNPDMFGGDADDPVADVSIGAVGSVWGGAYSAEDELLFLGALTKRHIGFGTRGIGGVYVVDYSSDTPSVSTSFSLQGETPANGGAALDFGSVTRTTVAGAIATDNDLSDDPEEPNRDLDAYLKVGTTGIGDLELEEDSETLWLVNLNEPSLVSIDVSDASALPGTINRFLILPLAGVPACANGNFRPFALQFLDGTGYLGGVCDAVTSQDRDDLSAHVLSFDPDDVASGFTSVLSFDLDFTREPTFHNPAGDLAVANTISSTWRPWHFDYVANSIGYAAEVSFGVAQGIAQPILSNIVFTEDQSMVLGFTDRFSHQLGYMNYAPSAGSVTLLEGMSGGDLIHACKTDGGWTLEGGAGCDLTDDDSILDSDGPSGTGEFYSQDAYFANGDSFPVPTHSEIALGGLVARLGSGEVMSSVFDPISDTNLVRTNGVTRFSTTTGNIVDGYLIVPDPLLFPGYLGKAGGLGELILRCTAAPIEVGNYIWIDSDGDGVQDPNEEVLPGVTVQLVAADETVLATAVTDENGYYLFSSRPATSSESQQYGISALAPGVTDLTIRVPLDQSALTGYLVTTADGDSSSNGDERDSDCASDGSEGIIQVTLGEVGDNDHSYDCGFTTDECSEDLSGDVVALDSSLRGLDITTRLALSVRSRFEKAGLCPSLSAKRRRRLRRLSNDDYESGWQFLWVELSSQNFDGCQRDSLTCNTVDQSEDLSSVDTIKSRMETRARRILTARCMRDNSSRPLKRRRRRVRKQLSAVATEFDTAFASYPSSIISCQ